MDSDIKGNFLKNDKTGTSKNDLQSLFNSMEDFVFVLDFKAQIIYVNSIVLKRLNYSKEELIGKNVLFVHPHDRHEEVIAIIEEMIKGEREICPIPLLTKDGNLIQVETKVTKGKWGNRDVLFGFSRDITERKQMEQEMKENSKKMEILNQIIINANKAGDFSKLIKKILKNTLELMNFEGGGIYLVNESSRTCDFICYENLPADFIENADHLDIDTKPYSFIFIEGKSIFTENYHQLNPERSEKWGFLSLASIPLTAREKVIGALNIVSKSRYLFSELEKEILQAIGRETGTLIAKMKAEEALRESEEKFRVIAEEREELDRIINRSPAIVLLWRNSEDWPVEYVSENVIQFGYTPEDFYSNNLVFADIIHPDDIERVVAEVNKYSQEKHNSFVQEYRIIAKDGGVHWVDDRTWIRRDSEGNITHFQGIVIDITERRKIEERLRFTQFSLDHSGEPAFWMDSNAHLIYVNKATSKSLGYSREELFNMTVHDFDPDFPVEVWPEHWEEVKKRGSFTLESHHRNKDGKVFPVEITVNYLEFGGKEYNCAFARDISERKESERNLKDSEEKLREAFDQASLYKDIFAHDINNILQNIQSSLELSSMYLKNPEKLNTVKELYGIIKEQVNRGSKLISNVRKLSTLHESKFTLKPIRVNHTLKESIKFLKHSFQTRKLNIQFNYNKKEYFVYANELLLDIFENLLLNAVRHNSNVNVKIEIRVSKEDIERKRFVKIQLIDNGDGIEDIRKEHIFERGSKEISSSGGMGLGLSLVKKTIDRYNGKIWVEDRVKGDYSKGSNFILLLQEGI